MSRIPDFKRIVKEDYPDKYHDLIDKLALPINSHIEQVRNLFNKNIDFENLSQEFITLSFTTGANSQPISELKFKTNLKRNVRGIMPVSLTITSTTGQFPAFIPMISFVQADGIVYIKNIGGLSPNTGYQMSFVTVS